MPSAFRTLLSSVVGSGPRSGGGGGGSSPGVLELFPRTDPARDGEACLRDCESCSVRLPRGFKINEDHVLYGNIKKFSTHLVVATGKTDWTRDVTDEQGSVMQAVGATDGPTNGRMMLSASNMPTPRLDHQHHHRHHQQPATTALLLPAFTLIDNVQPSNVRLLLDTIVSRAPTTTSPLQPSTTSADAAAAATSASADGVPPLTTRPCPHRAVILMCSQRTRDARCGQSAPLLRKELERHLRPLGLQRDLDDDRPGGVAIYFVSHVGGHKYSANVLVYRRPNAFGLDDVDDHGGEAEGAKPEDDDDNHYSNSDDTTKDEADVGAAQCIWLARVRPEDCENLVRYTVLRGKVVKPESQLRGGFDRGRAVVSW